MGTRGLFGVRINGEDKLTYNHFDSYPEGLGKDLALQLETILDKQGIEWLKGKAQALKLVDEDSPPSTRDKTRLKKFSDTSVSGQSLDDWYCLLRDLQGNLAGTLEAGIMIDSNDFIKDSLFCEWAYIINLDDMLFEIYRGFQKRKHRKGRYAQLPARDDYAPTGVGQYYPCALFRTYPLSYIPEGWYDSIES